MTTFPFVAPPQGVFTFQPTLTDLVGNTAASTGTVTWALYGARWFLNLFQLDGTRVFSRPLIASPGGRNLQAVAWARGVVTAACINPHGWAIDGSFPLTVSGCVPDAYNGDVAAYVTGPLSFQYPLAADPGVATVVGSAAFAINLAAGYFASSIVYRNGDLVVTP